MIDIATAVSGVTALLGLAKGAIAARDDVKAQDAISEIQAKLLDITTAALTMSQANISLTDEIRALKDSIHKFENKEREDSGYELTEVSPGSYAYKSTNSNQPAHHLCQPCRDAGVKTVLRFHHHKGSPSVREYRKWTCVADGKHSFTYYPR